MTVNCQQSTINDYQQCLYTLDAHQLINLYISETVSRCLIIGLGKLELPFSLLFDKFLPAFLE